MGPPLRWMLDTPCFTAFVSSHLQGRLLEGDGEYPVYRVLRLVFGAGHRMLGIFDIQTDKDDFRIYPYGENASPLLNHVSESG